MEACIGLYVITYQLLSINYSNKSYYLVVVTIISKHWRLAFMLNKALGGLHGPLTLYSGWPMVPPRSPPPRIQMCLQQTGVLHENSRRHL